MVAAASGAAADAGSSSCVKRVGVNRPEDAGGSPSADIDSLFSATCVVRVASNVSTRSKTPLSVVLDTS